MTYIFTIIASTFCMYATLIAASEFDPTSVPRGGGGLLSLFVDT